MKDEFIISIIHDLKSPILAEQRAIEFLLSRKEKEVDVTGYLIDFYNTNQEILTTIINVISTYHLQKEDIEPALNRQELNLMVEESLEPLKYLIKDREIKIKKNLGEIPAVWADKTQIKRVIINIISNAIKHNDKGIEILIKTYVENDFAIVSIENSGRSLSKEEKEHLFKRYYTKSHKLGSGLGLYICKEIITKHNGKIWFEDVEQGAKFLFTLPLG